MLKPKLLPFNPLKPVAHSEQKVLSAPAAARELGISTGKVLGWIRTGELTAMNLATSRNGRPRYAIARDDLEEFKRGRRVIPSAGPATTRKLRRRTPKAVKEFF